jgi:hypothetical protein
MGHESQIEPWLPLTTVLLVSFRADWLREEAMKPVKKKIATKSGWSGRSELTSRYVGLEARETPAVKGEEFSLDFPFYRTSEWPKRSEFGWFVNAAASRRVAHGNLMYLFSLGTRHFPGKAVRPSGRAEWYFWRD